MRWLIFGLMTGALLCAFHAGVILLSAWDRLRSGEGGTHGYATDRSRALGWATVSAVFLLVLAVMGLWRVAGWVSP